MSHQRFATTSAGGLHHDSLPMRLYHESKLGVWDPRRIDLDQDARDWARLSEVERDVLVRLTALFQAGEEGMTSDVLPLVMTVVREGRVEEQLFLTSFLSEEARHTEFFRRFLDEVCRAAGDLHRYHTPSFRRLFYEELPRAMDRLLGDSSRAAQAEALVHYTMIGEGVLAETGYHLFTTALQRNHLMPGFLEGLLNVQRDEAGHMAYGVFVLSRLVAEDHTVWPVIQRRMNALLPQAVDLVNEFFEPYDPFPFGLSLQDTLDYAIDQFARRSARIERAQPSAAETAGAGGLAARSGAPGDEAVEQLGRWVGEQVQPARVRLTQDAASQVYVFQIAGATNSSQLLVTQELFDHHPAGAIIAALEEHRVADRLREAAGHRLVCLQVGGRIIVQYRQ